MDGFPIKYKINLIFIQKIKKKKNEIIQMELVFYAYAPLLNHSFFVVSFINVSVCNIPQYHIRLILINTWFHINRQLYFTKYNFFFFGFQSGHNHYWIFDFQLVPKLSATMNTTKQI